jgi:hypothetical protein
VECKHRCVNFRRVSDHRRAFMPAFRVTGISDDWYRSTMGVILIALGTPQSVGDSFGCTGEYLGALATGLGAPTTSLRVPGSIDNIHGSTWEHQRQVWEHLTSEQSSLGKTTSSLGMLLVPLEIIATTSRSTIFKTHVFSLYSHLCIYIATHLHTVYLDWLQVVLESTSKCT